MGLFFPVNKITIFNKFKENGKGNRNGVSIVEYDRGEGEGEEEEAGEKKRVEGVGGNIISEDGIGFGRSYGQGRRKKEEERDLKKKKKLKYVLTR